MSDKQGKTSGTRKPLTLEELRKLDGQPVWCVDGAGHECWCIVNAEMPECIDNECGVWISEFYALTGDGLHGLDSRFGWVAYADNPSKPACEYCTLDSSTRKVLGYDGSNDGIGITYGDGVVAIGSDSWGFEINYCPICGCRLI